MPTGLRKVSVRHVGILCSQTASEAVMLVIQVMLWVVKISIIFNLFLPNFVSFNKP